MKYINHTLSFVLLSLVLLSVLGFSSCSNLPPRVIQESVKSETYVILDIKSRALAKGKLETSDVAKLYVSLPASYATSPNRRYPVVYALHGFGDGAESMISPLRRILEEDSKKNPEVILVSVEGGNSLGGSFYANSPATGNWEDLVTTETVSLIDSRYRTIASPAGRLLAGFSMGGFGAWNIALTHPDVFSSAWVCCPGAWDKNGLEDTLKTWNKTYRNAYGAAYSPDLGLPKPYAQVPKFDGSAKDTEVIALWKQGFGNITEKLAAYAAQPARLTAIVFVYGSRDSYKWIPLGTQYAASSMASAGLPVSIQDFPASHEMTDNMLAESFVPLVREVFAQYESQAQSKNTIKYFRNLVYNHASPFIEMQGNYEIDGETAKKVPCYAFVYTTDGKLSEIINNNPNTWKKHPLCHLGDVYKVRIEYSEKTGTRIFLDRNGQRMKSLRGVYKEVFEYNDSGIKTSLRFLDLNDKPMESEWKIARYEWEEKNGMIIERRYNLQNALAMMSPYFNFALTGIQLNKRGLPEATYNLNERLEITDNDKGIACYKDVYDEQNNHVRYSYFNKSGLPAQSNYGLTVGVKEYDVNGNMIRESLYNKENAVFHQQAYSY